MTNSDQAESLENWNVNLNTILLAFHTCKIIYHRPQERKICLGIPSSQSMKVIENLPIRDWLKRKLGQKGFSCCCDKLQWCDLSHPNWHMVSKFIRLPMFKKSCSLKMNKSSASAYVSSLSFISIEYSGEPWMNLNWISTVSLCCCNRSSYWRWTTPHDGLSVLRCFAGNHFCRFIKR